MNLPQSATIGEISEMSRLIRGREISPVEVVEACLARIEELNPKLNAFITVLKDEALRNARIAEEEINNGNLRGPLHGIPIGIKDFYDTSGIKTTAAFGIFKDRVPRQDAVSVAKLKDAGAIIIGKTNMHTLGMGTTGLESFFGPVKNPWNAGYIPGGSSSGSAAAVASGMCYATLDTDAIGSCRLPAAVCGVVGFKGTFGLISLEGILAGTEPPDEIIRWLSHAGITARSVEDVAFVVEVLAQGSQGTKPASGKLRIGIASNLEADAEVMAAFQKAADAIRNLGHVLTKVSAPFWDFSQGLGTIKVDRKSVAERVFKDIDAIVLPTIPTPTPSVKAAGNNPQALSAEYTVFANYYGLPAISVPCGFDKHGLPLGFQIVGKPDYDGVVLQLASEYQATQGGESKKYPA